MPLPNVVRRGKTSDASKTERAHDIEKDSRAVGPDSVRRDRDTAHRAHARLRSDDTACSWTRGHHGLDCHDRHVAVSYTHLSMPFKTIAQ